MKISMLLALISFMNFSYAAEIASDCSAINGSREVNKKEVQLSKAAFKSGKVSKK